MGLYVSVVNYVVNCLEMYNTDIQINWRWLNQMYIYRHIMLCYPYV